jgi:heat shock protein HslJ
MLVVERFLGLSPGETCGARFVTEPFENTYWKLTLLNGSAVVRIERRSEAHLLFQGEGRLAGSDGCNRLFGRYSLQGETIVFGQMGGTTMACLEPVRDREFLAALGKAATWRVLGTHLELRSDQGVILARFESVQER